MEHRSVRLAGLSDIPKILDMAKRLYSDSTYSVLSFDLNKAREGIEKFIVENGKEFMVIVSYEGDTIVGALAAYSFQPLFSNDRVAVETLMWLEPDHRTSVRGNDLLDAYEYWAKAAGCKIAQYGLLSSADQRLSKLYERRGCSYGESVYFKILGE